jgi:hypothetical protein
MNEMLHAFELEIPTKKKCVYVCKLRKFSFFHLTARRPNQSANKSLYACKESFVCGTHVQTYNVSESW